MALESTVRAGGLAGAMLLRLVVPVATMLAIGALALLLLFTPLYLHAALDASGAPQWLGMSADAAHEYSDRTVGDLLFGPAGFDFAAPDGSPFFTSDERAHMRDVRTVLYGFLALSAIAAGLLLIVAVRRRVDRGFVRSVGRGGGALAIGTIVVGVFAVVAFDAAFELFHRLLFPGGNFSFDPASQRLVQLYPFAFWQLSALALGVLLVAGGAATWLVARRLQARATRA